MASRGKNFIRIARKISQNLSQFSPNGEQKQELSHLTQFQYLDKPDYQNYQILNYKGNNANKNTWKAKTK